MLNVQVLDKHDDNVDGWVCEPDEQLSSIVAWIANGDFHSAYALDLSEPHLIHVQKDPGVLNSYTVEQDGRIIYGVYFDEQ